MEFQVISVNVSITWIKHKVQRFYMTNWKRFASCLLSPASRDSSRLLSPTVMGSSEKYNTSGRIAHIALEILNYFLIYDQLQFSLK
jgi:hypothetical protein